MKKLTLTKQSLEKGAFEISVIGCIGDPVDPAHTAIVIEYYEGKVRVHVWNGKQDPTTSIDLKEYLFRNFYKCSECGTEWQDEWDCTCNDRCPKCNAEIEPFKSEDIHETTNTPPQKN